ncbi:MAG: PIN domain-containing protein [Candidatus Omnitrophica bacterium]|nr:PIN domain-containing protein [Candidatus Omnitrophota bacterium]MBU4202456.1 PIN domain-containing protein [Acidobacteriota bacterium]MBU4330020.1 PIN domain-containing protein [Acidobacteriota bacterium]MBU4496132.1 PIN domain-containing protein [Acidobacteriota bacterium]MCG2817239.1 PIN domain-containing protein [Candidatus Aminicenantes bacterium]
MFVVDTNILVYAADEDSPFHTRCLELIEEWRKQASPWYTTWGILYEFLRVVTHPKVFRKPWSVGKAWTFVDTLLASPSLDVLLPGERHGTVAAEVLKSLPFLSGNLMFDAQTAILMKEHGLKRIYTRDADFFRFPFLEPVDPAAQR